MAAATIPIIDRAAEPFSDEEVQAITAAAAQAEVGDHFEVVAVAGRPITQPEAIDQDLQNLGVKRPGETIFNWNQGSSPDMRFDATMTGVPDDMIDVVIYNRQGFPVKMKKSMAKIRIGKRSPEDGQPVFFFRPPVPTPMAGLSCRYPGCRKKFFDVAAQNTHYQHRHTTAYLQAKEAEEASDRRRLIELQERSIAQGAANATALTLLVERLAGGEKVSPDDARAALDSVRAGVDFESMSRDELRAFCEANAISYPAQWQQLSKSRWVAIAQGEEVIG